MQETLSNLLNAELKHAGMRLESHPRASKVLAGTATAEELAQYYVTAHAVVRLATTFLSTARDALRTQGGDPTLIALFDRKAQEESGHDRWLEEDLEAIGFPLGASQTPVPTPAAALYNAFHSGIAALQGEAFLGTAWVLESLAAYYARDVADRLQATGRIAAVREGLGLRFLRSHGEEDVGHVEELARLVDAHVHSCAARSYVLTCARFTSTVYADFF